MRIGMSCVAGGLLVGMQKMNERSDCEAIMGSGITISFCKMRLSTADFVWMNAVVFRSMNRSWP